MSRRSFAALLVLGVLFLLGAWMLSAVEWIEQEVSVEWTREAERQPYLAARRFIEKQGVPSVQASGLLQFAETTQQTPGPKDTIVLIDAFGVLSEARAEAALSWVHEGGHLIVSGHNPYVSERRLENDRIFDFFGVRVKRDLNQLAEIHAGIEISEQNERNLSCSALLAPVLFPVQKVDQPIQIAFPGWQTLELNGTYDATKITDTLGVRLAQMGWGQGTVTFVSGTDLWSNPYIACYDNAYLLWLLTQGSDKVWFWINQEAPSLWQRLWNKAWLWLLTMSLLVVLFLWRQAVRFGPVLPVASDERRRLLEHIDAATGFLWLHGQGNNLLTELRQDIQARMARRVPTYSSWPAEAQHEELARLTALPGVEIENAMSAQVSDQETFTRAVHQLQQIRKRI